MLYSEHYGLKLVKEENFDHIHKKYMELYFMGDGKIQFECGFIRIQAESLYDLAWNLDIDYHASKNLSTFVLELLHNSIEMMETIHVYGYIEESDENIDIEDGFYSLNKTLNQYNCWVDKEL